MLNTKNTNALQSIVLIIFLKPTYVSSHLFCEVSEIQWFLRRLILEIDILIIGKNNITDTFEDQIAARNVRDDEALPAKVMCTRIRID